MIGWYFLGIIDNVYLLCEVMLRFILQDAYEQRHDASKQLENMSLVDPLF